MLTNNHFKDNPHNKKKSLLMKDKYDIVSNIQPSIFMPFPIKKQPNNHQNPTKHSSLISPFTTTTRQLKQQSSSTFSQHLDTHKKKSSHNKNNKDIIKQKQKQRFKQKQQKQKSTTQKKILLQQQDVLKILEQSQHLIKQNSLIQGINLLKAMKDPSMQIQDDNKNNKNLRIIIVWNLAIAYYQTGFLQQAYDEFVQVVEMLTKMRQMLEHNNEQNNEQKQTILKQIHYKRLQAKIQLQICILFSQLGNHDDALKHARKSCKLHYQIVYEMMIMLCKQFFQNKKNDAMQSYDPREISIQQINVYNNIMIMQHLNKLVSDLAPVLGQQSIIKQVKQLYQQIKPLTSMLFKQSRKIDMQLFYNFNNITKRQNNYSTNGNINITNTNKNILMNNHNNKKHDNILSQSSSQSQLQLQQQQQSSSLLQQQLSPSSQQQSILKWIYESKILDRIQLKSLSPLYFHHNNLLQKQTINNNNAIFIQAITYLAISFYCYSTEVRFVQKKTTKLFKQTQFKRQQHYEQYDDILQSQHWLSRSLQIAYSFLPSNAPILNQILTVHDRFHSLDKQTIHQDKEVCGYFKVLRSLSKPKSTYSSKGGHNNAPIMIRVQAPRMRDDNKRQENERKSERSYGKISEEQQEKHTNTIDISTFTKNNKIKGLSTRIKILEFNDTIKLSSNQKHKTLYTNNHNIKKPPHTTINDMSFIQSDKQKKQRISKIYHSTNRNYVGKKSLSSKNGSRLEDIPKSASEMDGKARISEDLLFRPHSYDSKYLSMTVNEIDSSTKGSKPYSTLGGYSVKKRRSLSQNGRNPKEKLEKIVYNGSVKLDGLKLTGRRMNQTFQIDTGLLQRLTQAHNNLNTNNNNNQSTILQNSLIKGNIFINNNINLFISKSSSKEHPKTTREQNKKNDTQMSKRQKFLTKRRLSLINVQDDVYNGNDL